MQGIAPNSVVSKNIPVKTFITTPDAPVVIVGFRDKMQYVLLFPRLTRLIYSFHIREVQKLPPSLCLIRGCPPPFLQAGMAV